VLTTDGHALVTRIGAQFLAAGDGAARSGFRVSWLLSRLDGFRPRGNAPEDAHRHGGTEGDGMRIRWTTTIVMATGVLTLIAGVAAGGGGSAHAATLRSGPASAGSTSAGSTSAGPQATGYVADKQLNGVAAITPSNAWAVGSTGSISGRATAPKTLILHWNGKTWS
jgi:hypothetical protein